MVERSQMNQIIAELCRGISAIFPDDRLEPILFGSYARGDAEEGSDIDILKLGLVKPVPPEAVTSAVGYGTIVFFEEGIQHGGIAEDFCSLLSQSGWQGHFIIRAVNDRFIPHATVNSALAGLGLDADGMYDTIRHLQKDGTN